MQVQIEDTGPCKKLLHIEVPVEKVKEKLDESYIEFCQKAEIKGFRKGHAPRKLIEKQYGESINREVQATIITDTVDEIIKENDFKLIGTPDLPETEDELDIEAPLTFDVTIEVQPQFELPDYSTCQLVRKSTDVTDEDIEKGVEKLRRREATYVPAPDAEVKEDDMVVADVNVTSDGNVVDHVEDSSFRPLLKQLIGVPCDTLPEVIAGAKTGDTRKVTVKLPKTHRNSEYAGKEAELEITVKDIKRLSLPEVTEDWAKKHRFDNLEELREDITKSLKSEKDRESRSDLEEQVVEQLLQVTTFDVPERLVQRIIDGRERRVRLTLQSRNVPEEEIEEQLATSRSETQESAQRECRVFFLIEAIADDRHIFATEDEIRQRVAEIAANYGHSFEAVRAEMERDGQIDDLRAMMRRDKAIDYVIEKCAISDEA